jgi:transketolase
VGAETSGKAQVEMKATRQAYAEALVELGREDPKIVVLDADLSASTMTQQFGRAFAGRFFNTGIAEQNLMSVAGGLAAGGKTVFASTFAVFATGRAYDQVRVSIAHNKLNVKIAATHSGLTVGEDGASHQALEDIALMRALPNMTVVVPADATEAGQAVRLAAGRQGPFYIRLGRPPVPVLFGSDYRFELGRAKRLLEGADVALFATGHMVAVALDAARLLDAEGISVEVVNVSTIKPLDVDAVVAAARKCGAAVTVEEHSIIGGLGSAVAEALAESFPVLLRRVGVRDVFGESGKPADLLRAYGLVPESVAAACREVMARR